MRFVVTGANGLVGSRLCAVLEKRGHEVTGLGRGPTRLGAHAAYRTCELTEEAAVLKALSDARPEVVVHTASMTEVDACEKNPAEAFAANVLAAAHVAKGAKSQGSHLVHVSTDYVFDGEAGPYDEAALPNPKGVYALTKHMGEQAVQTFAPSWAVARTAVVYGWPPAARPNFGAWLVSALRAGQEVRLFEDQYVSPSLADRVALMLAELGERRLPGIWNTAGSEVVNRVEFGRALCQVFGFNPRLLIATKMADAKLPSPRPPRSGLKTDKAQAQLSAKPLALLESLEQFHQAFRAA